MRKRAFTLFELIAVIVTVAAVFLAVVLVVSAVRKSALATKKAEVLTASQRYAQRYDKVTVEGHEYLIFIGSFVLHNEACPCRAHRTDQ